MPLRNALPIMGARAPPVAIENGIGAPLEASVMLSAGTGCPTVQEKLRVMPSATVSFGAGLPTVSRMGRAKSPYPEFCTRSVALYAPALLAVVGGSASQAGIVEASTVKGVPPAAADVSKAVWADPGAKLTGDPALRVHMSSTDEATSAVAVAVTVMAAVTAR